MGNYRIRFNHPTMVGSEFDYIKQAIRSGHISGDGVFTKRCQTLLEDTINIPKVLLTTSCTHALAMAALLIDIQPGDEVILPSFTFVSTANAFVLRGALPVFADIRPDTLNMDESALSGLITERTKAIIPVHYAGVGCEMNIILEVASRHGLAVIEDSAQGLFGKYRGEYLGTFGMLAAQSFHETKNITCGEGGALFINDRRLIERAEVLREKGTNRSRFFRGHVDKYTWVDTGSSYLPSEILAAILLAQLEKRLAIQEYRRKLWQYYKDNLAEWAADYGIRLPRVPTYCDQTYHMFYLQMPSLELRDGMIEYLKHFGIQSVFHYQPLHLSEMGRRFGGLPGDCPVTESVAERLLRLPLHNHLKEPDQAFIVDVIKSFPCQQGLS